MKYNLFLLFIIIYATVYSQTADNLPEVTINDLSETECGLDSTANAAILYDMGTIFFKHHNQGIGYVFAKTRRVKVYNKQGFEQADINILLSIGNSDSEKLLEFKATTYTLKNGKIVKTTIDKKSLYQENVSKWLTVKKFTFPNLSEGSIIEYSYRIESPFVMHLDPWYFQHEIPTLKSRLTFEACPYFRYVYLVNKGNLNFVIDTSYSMRFDMEKEICKNMEYEWELDSIPAFIKEPYITTPKDYLMKVEFQLESYFSSVTGEKFEVITTWDQLIYDLAKSFNAFIEDDKKDTKAIINSLNLNDKSSIEKAKAIYKYVNSNYYYDHSMGAGTGQNKKNLIKTKTGNAAEINLLLISLLKEAGITAYPLLLSTRKHGKIYYDYPLLNRFNYLTALVYDSIGKYYLDATDPLLPFGLLPPKCINGYGLEVKGVKSNDDVKFYPLTPTIPDQAKVQLFLMFDEQDGLIKAKLMGRFKGYKALALRKLLINEKESFFQKVFDGDNLTLDNLHTDNLKNADNDLVIKMKVSESVDKAGNKIFISPLLYNPYTENVLKLSKRSYPIDFGFINREYFTTNIVIPAGYQADYVPHDTTFFACDSTLSCHFTTQVSKTNVQLSYQIKQKKLKYNPIQYTALKQFYDMVVKTINRKIVLSKKTNQ